MIRTQVYLTEKEKNMLTQLSKETGESKSTLIRKAIASFCDSKRKKENFGAMIHKTAGAWKNNHFDFNALRKESNERLERFEKQRRGK